MKTNFLLCCALGAAVGGFAIVGTGCRENKASAQVAVFPAAATSAHPAAVEKPVAPPPAVAPTPPPTPANPVVAAAPVPPSQPTPAPIIITNPTPTAPASAPAAAPAPTVVQESVVPEAATVSPALADLVKMMHSGVSEDVLISYVTNSTETFLVGADQVVYLKDIGASPLLITTLLNHESQPQIISRRQAMAAVKPLPEGVAVNAPVTGVFPGKTPPAEASEPTPVTDAFSASAGAPPPPAGTEPAPVAPTQPAVDTATFYTSLAPYGTWVDIPDYGYCWRPTVAVYNSGWSPYCNDGRWLWSDAGWYWYSDYSWGWAPFHYGRWCTYPGYGWVWSPGTVWGPAWVSWRYTDSYCGWAPLPPACGWSAGVGLTWYGSGVSVGFGFGLASSCYTFVGWNNFCSPYPYRYCAQPAVVQNIFNKTVVVNNYYSADKYAVINKGVGTERIAGPVPKATIREASLSGGKMVAGANRREMLQKDGTLSVYRPEYSGANGAVTTRRTTSAAGFASGNPATGSSGRPAGMDRSTAVSRSGSVPSSLAPAGTAAGSSRPAAAMPTSRFQATPRASTPTVNPSTASTRSTAPAATPSTSATRSRPTVYPGARSASPSATRTPSAGGTVRSTAPAFSAPRSVTTPSSRPTAPSPAPAFRAPSAPSSTPRSVAPAVRSTPSYTRPAARPAPSYTAPAVRSAPRYSAPAVRSAPSYSAPAVRSAPSYSSPSVRSTPSYSAPTTRSSPSGGRSGKN